MAERRMISKKIVDTDLFTDMPMSTRLLYYELNWRADDDGFVSSPKKIIKMSGCSEDDLKFLFLKNFVIPFDSGIILITDWRIHNSIQKDRYHETQYLGEKSAIAIAPNGSYIPTIDIKCIQDVSKMETEARLGQARLGKASQELEKQSLFNQFWSAYPKKQNKSYSEQQFYKIPNLEENFRHIMQSLEKFKKTKDWLKDDGQYVPNASTWINKERWEDFVYEDVDIESIHEMEEEVLEELTEEQHEKIRMKMQGLEWMPDEG